jgi:hypothetical protein
MPPAHAFKRPPPAAGNPDAKRAENKAMPKKNKIKWSSKPESHDYPAAFSYLSLHYDAKTCAALVKRLKEAPISSFKAKDIFRASRLSLLGVSNSHVEADLKKIRRKIKLAPLLLVRDPANGKVIIADGYHRLCAVYACDEDAVIPCQIT